MTGVVSTKEIRKEGLTYLEKIFKHKTVHDSLLFLLKNDIKDQRFVQASRLYGIDLIQHAVQTSLVRNASKDLVVDVLTKDKQVIQKEIDVVKYFVMHP